MPLESLASGTAAVVSSGLALDQLWPEYPLRCSELAPGPVLETLRRGLGDSEVRDQVVVQAEQRLVHLTWARSARLLIEELRRVAPP